MSKAAAFCYRNRLNGNLYLNSIEGPVGMMYAIFLVFASGKKSNICRLEILQKDLKKWPFFLLDAQISFIPFL